MSRDYSPLTAYTSGNAGQYSTRGVAIDHFLIHHAATTSLSSVLGMMSSGSRQVSANYVIDIDGTVVGVVPEHLRAWTSGSSSDGGAGAAWDRRSITVEVIDVDTNWNTSPASNEALARLIADCSLYYGFPITRAGAASSILSHGELWTFYQASYPIACPGLLPVDAVAQRAAFIAENGTETPRRMDDDMSAFYRIVEGEPGGGTVYWQDKPNTPLVPLNLVTWQAYEANGAVYLNCGAADVNALVDLYGMSDIPHQALVGTYADHKFLGVVTPASLDARGEADDGEDA
jgi:hypothetical protein